MEKITKILSSISDFFIAFYEGVIDVISFITSILGFIWYAGKTLIVGVFKLLYSVLDGSVFYNVNRAFVYISQYIGGPATIFLSALLFVIIIRILIAFVFKIMRLNIDYNSFDKQTRKSNAWDNASEYRKKMSTRV